MEGDRQLPTVVVCGRLVNGVVAGDGRLTINDLCTSLDPERLDQLMVIKSNNDLCNDFVKMVKLPVNEVTEESEDSEDENDYEI